jgi:hypothetical protein
MSILDRNLLRQLGTGASIASVCQQAGISREEFDRRWKETIASRVPATSGRLRTGVSSQVEIERDEWGIPHIYAQNDADLFFGFGYAMAQDRLFQLDYLRRKASGRLSEILGKSGLELDLIARTVGLRRIAEAEWEQLSEEVRDLVTAFSNGVNAVIDASHDNLPIEFDLLDYGPEQWSPVDCIAIECEFRWYLTGRFPVIVMPELASAHWRRPTYREFLLGEADDESILPAGSYPSTCCGVDPLGPFTRSRTRELRQHHRAQLRLPHQNHRRGTLRPRRQQQLGGRRFKNRQWQAAGCQRPAHRLRGGLVLVRSASLRRDFQRRWDGLCWHAGGDVRPNRGGRVGADQ